VDGEALQLQTPPARYWMGSSARYWMGGAWAARAERVQGYLALGTPHNRQARLGTDKPASGRTKPPRDRQARLGTDRPASGWTDLKMKT